MDKSPRRTNGKTDPHRGERYSLGNKAPALKRKAFTLTEVLIGLALASIVLGVVLQAATRDVISVARTPDRYQALLRASQVLEYRMEEDHQGDDPRVAPARNSPTTSATDRW